MVRRAKNDLKWSYKTLLTLVGVILLKVLEVLLLQVIIYWIFKIPLNEIEELITVIIVFIVITPFTFITWKHRRNSQEAERRFRVLAEHSLVGIYTYYDDKFWYVNRRFLEKTGYKRDEIIGQDFHKLIVEEDQPILRESIQKCINGELETSILHLRAIRKDQSIMDIELLGTVTFSEGYPILMGSILDISERKRNETLLNQLAFKDPLTGLVNRRAFEDNLDKLIIDYGKENKTAAILFIDLDGFKMINDSYGHEVGDCVLKEMADRLLNCVRKEDTLARFAGDEFTIVLVNIDKDLVINFAESIMEEVKKPIAVHHHQIFITTSIGISFFPEHGKSPKILLKNADQAMYEAKNQGKNTYQIYLEEDR